MFTKACSDYSFLCLRMCVNSIPALPHYIDAYQFNSRQVVGMRLPFGSREAMWIIGFASVKIKVPGLAECVLFKLYRQQFS
jgi:hypothetical protein